MRNGWHMSQAPPERHGILHWTCPVAEEWQDGRLIKVVSVRARTRGSSLRKAAWCLVALNEAGVFRPAQE